MVEIDYDRLATAIANRLQTAAPPDKIIWTAKQCADYLGISERHFVDRTSKIYGFPNPIKLPTERGTKGHARWYAAEVQSWTEKYRKLN